MYIKVISDFQISGEIGQALVESKIISSVRNLVSKDPDYCCLPPLAVFYITVKQRKTVLKYSSSSSIAL